MPGKRQFGSIRQLPSGRWQARYRDVDGELVAAPSTFVTKGDAGSWLAAAQTDRTRGTFVDHRAGEVRFEDWAQEWAATIVNLRESTTKRDLDYLKRYLLPAFGTLQLSAIDHMRVRRWVAQLSQRGLAPATVVKAAQIMAKIMRMAVDAGRLAANPCDRVPLPKIERATMRFLDAAEVAALADAIGGAYRALVLASAYGGFRIGELVGLRAARVDLTKGTVDIAQTITEVSGRLIEGPPKTRAGRRVVPLPRFVVEELGAHLGSTPAGSNDLVFTAPEGGPLRLATWRSRFWAPAVARAGLEHLRPHDLRHTAVALWIAAGADPKLIAERAGHTSVAVVLDRYGHLYPDASDRLNDVLEVVGRSAAEESRRPRLVPLDVARA